MNDPLRFNYVAAPQRVLHGAGRAAELGAELAQLGARRGVLLCSPGQRGAADALRPQLGERCAGVLPLARVHVPAELAREAGEQMRRLDADALVALGGGSAIGLAKALALESALPIVALPTTYAGSEATPIYGITRDGDKQTGRDLLVLPRVVIYDPDLGRQLPLRSSVASAINGMAHGVEALYAVDRHPITQALAQRGLRLFREGLDALLSSGERGQMLTAAWLCGHVLGQSQMGLHHQICHVLGGRLDLPHAQLHTVMLPHALAFHADRLPGLGQEVAAAMGVPDPVAWLIEVRRAAGLPASLRDLGVDSRQLPQLAAALAERPYAGRIVATEAAILNLLLEAWEGC